MTTYTNIINTAPFFTHLAADDQGYLEAARQEEMSHYLLEEGVTHKPSPFTTFYYPPKMFADAQTTLNVLVTLEDAFIAAYLVGVRDFSTADLRVTAARIMGIESDHRTLARVVAPGVAAQDGGPIENVTGIQGKAESVDPPNNNGYERTLRWTTIKQGGRRAHAVRRQDRGRRKRASTRASHTRSNRSRRRCRSRSANSTRSSAEESGRSRARTTGRPGPHPLAKLPLRTFPPRGSQTIGRC